MKIETVTGPSQPQTFGAKSEAQVSARERAIQALMRPNTPDQAAAQAQSHPVPNPTNISPEEFSAVQAPKRIAQDPGQTTSNESPVAEAAPEETKAAEEPLSSQYAILARKEKAIRQKERLLAQREAEMKAKAEAAQAPAAKPDVDLSKYVSKDDLLRDPFGVLNDNGLGYDKLTEIAANGPTYEMRQMMSKIAALEGELAKVKGETESTKKSFEETQNTQYKQAMNQITRDVNSLVRTDPSFETIKATNSQRDVVSLIERTFEEDGYLMSVEEAAQEVEEYLVNEAIRLSSLGKIKQRIAPKAPSAPAQQTTEQSKQPQMKTLTNAVSSTAKLSAKERAVLAFQGKLNK